LATGFEVVVFGTLAGSTTLGLESLASVEGLGRGAESIVLGGVTAIVLGVVEAVAVTVDTDTLSTLGAEELAETATLFTGVLVVAESAFVTPVVGESTFATTGAGQR
jgi:hypothetical protein